MANTTWSATDKVNCTITGLVVSGVTGAGGARTVDFLNSGKRYFEYTCTTWTVNAGVGVANSRAVLSTVAGTPTNASFIQGGNGNIWVNGVNTGVSLGTRANGDVICIAVDFSAPLIWYRVGAAGNWNNSAAANPATGVGGILISAVVSARLPVYGLFAVNSNVAQNITANFGDSAFVGVVPAGFTGGFLAGSTLPLSTISTQVGLEEFFTTNPIEWVTQIGLEMWASAAGDIPERMMVTQVGLEVWAQIPRDIQARVQVMA